MEYYYVRFYDRAEKEPSYYSNPAFLGVWQSGFDNEFIRQRIINAGKFNYTINYRID